MADVNRSLEFVQSTSLNAFALRLGGGWGGIRICFWFASIDSNLALESKVTEREGSFGAPSLGFRICEE